MAQVKVRSKKAAEYRIISASGVWGGITPHGMIYFDIFLEKPESPAETILMMDEKTGERREIIEEPSEPSLERILLTGVMVRPEVARSIGQWLIDKANESEVLARQSSVPHIVQ